MLREIIEQANEYKLEFHRRREQTVENNKSANREKEKLFQEKFHVEANKAYWKTISELIPNEVSTIEKRGKKEKEKDKQASIIVIQGPKPGKSTDLSRMHHVLVKLKHKLPTHMNPPTPPMQLSSESAKDAKPSHSPPTVASSLHQASVTTAQDPFSLSLFLERLDSVYKLYLDQVILYDIC